LGGFDLTPTYRNIHSKFSVKYYLNLVLVDEDDRRYYKQQEYAFSLLSPLSALLSSLFASSLSQNFEQILIGLSQLESHFGEKPRQQV
jgi:hypothetical protein